MTKCSEINPREYENEHEGIELLEGLILLLATTDNYSWQYPEFEQCLALR
jgi:hypothetical protein